MAVSPLGHLLAAFGQGPRKGSGAYGLAAACTVQEDFIGARATVSGTLVRAVSTSIDGRLGGAARPEAVSALASSST